MLETFLYSIVRFVPFSETSEFANIGIVLVGPQSNYFGFKLQRRKHGRVTNFFNEVDAAIYRTATRNLQEELQRMQRATNRDSSQLALRFDDMSIANLLLHELMRKREGLIRFDKVRMTIAESPDKELSRLYSYYVDRSFATPQYVEQAMEKEVRASLKSLNVLDRYSEARLKDGLYQARFPFVRFESGLAKGAIKPISMSQERPEAIIEHANKWAYAVTRLKDAGRIDGEVLFPVRAPSEDQSTRYGAFMEGAKLLEDAGGRVLVRTEPRDLRPFL